jgi:hypothetical protein
LESEYDETAEYYQKQIRMDRCDDRNIRYCAGFVWASKGDKANTKGWENPYCGTDVGCDSNAQTNADTNPYRAAECANTRH